MDRITLNVLIGSINAVSLKIKYKNKEEQLL